MEDKLRELRFSSLKQKRLHRNLTAAFQYLKGASKKRESNFLHKQIQNKEEQFKTKRAKTYIRC